LSDEEKLREPQFFSIKRRQVALGGPESSLVIPMRKL